MALKLNIPAPGQEQKDVNYQQAKTLKAGEPYRFNPPITVQAHPFVSSVFKGEKPVFDFASGRYETVENGHLVFVGFPVGATDNSDKWKFAFPVAAGNGLEITPREF